MPTIQRITPCLWFDVQAEDAVRFYVAIFKNSRVVQISYYGEEGYEVHGGKAGTVMTIDFELDGQPFTALNGGPIFKFTEAISFQIDCETQEEVDYYWTRLSEGGDVEAQQCGWLKDRFGLSWQVVPTVLREMLNSADNAAAQRTMAALLRMKKLDIVSLKRAFAGEVIT